MHSITAVQSEFSPFSHDMLHNDEKATADELGIGVVGFSPLGRGTLTDGIRALDELAPDDARYGLPRFEPEVFATNRRLVSQLESIASEHGATAAQIALTWVTCEGLAPIPGTRRRSRLEENARAADLTLSAEELARVRDALPAREVVGSRDGINAPQGTDR